MYRNLVISAALALLISGCGSSVKTPELVTVPESNGQGIVESGQTTGTQENKNISVEGNNTVGKFVTTANVFIPEGTQPKDARGDAACVENPCVIKCDQKDAGSVSGCAASEWKNLIDDVVLPTDYVALYSGTLDISEDSDIVLSHVGSTVTIEVPATAYWPDSPRWDKIHGVGCADMQVWVTDKCGNTTGEWVKTTIVQSCSSSTKKAISIDVDNIPAHIVMFVTMPKNHPNLAPCCTGGSK